MLRRLKSTTGFLVFGLLFYSVNIYAPGAGHPQAADASEASPLSRILTAAEKEAYDKGRAMVSGAVAAMAEGVSNGLESPEAKKLFEQLGRPGQAFSDGFVKMAAKTMAVGLVGTAATLAMQVAKEKVSEVLFNTPTLLERLSVDNVVYTGFLCNSSDAQGLEEAREEFKFCKENGVPPKKILLYGPPGTGKTQTAMNMAAVLNVPLYKLNCGSLNTCKHPVEEFIKVWNWAQNKEIILLLDEVNAFAAISKQNEVGRRLLSEALSRLSNNWASSKYKCIVVATSNNVVELNKAFRDRFELKRVGLPDKAARVKIVNCFSEKHFKDSVATRLFGPDFYLLWQKPAVANSIADLTSGYSIRAMERTFQTAKWICLTQVSGAQAKKPQELDLIQIWKQAMTKNRAIKPKASSAKAVSAA